MLLYILSKEEVALLLRWLRAHRLDMGVLGWILTALIPSRAMIAVVLCLGFRVGGLDRLEFCR